MVLISLVPVLNLLYFYISTFWSMCAVPNMAVFWSSLTSYFPGMLLTYFLNDFWNSPSRPYYYYYYYYYYCHYHQLFSINVMLVLFFVIFLFKLICTKYNAGRPRRRWVDNIRMDLQEVGCGYMDWIGVAQDRDRWRTLLSAVMNLRVPWNAGNF